MKQALLKLLKQVEPDKEKSPFLHTAYDAFFTFAFTPNMVTKGGVHVRDGMDLKRQMVHVVLALQVLYLFGTYNIGHQHFVALGEYTGFLQGAHLKLVYGLVKMIPIFIVTHVVGLGIEFYYAYKKGHGVEEGFLVSGALIPLIMPPDIPLWILGVSVAFAVWIGKEAFGGTGMNILNVALLARVFVFFAYPTYISGDEVWIAGIEKAAEGGYFGQAYGAVYGVFDSLFGSLGLATFGDGGKAVIDGYSGATPLGLASKGGWDAVTQSYTTGQMLWGTIPGSIGESSKPLIIVGALFLIITKIADWRIMLSMVIGAVVMGLLLNAWGATPFMEVPWYYHFYMGSFLFAMAFMATDPVTASSTSTGKLIYGFLIGFVGMIVRVLNPAYPEGWMLAILFMNVFAPLIDHYVLQANINRRAKRLQAAMKPAETAAAPAAAEAQA
ncbi:NADH:ubiquinone reductase (Na(+)-transporting) subunit B [Phaeodactylibacter luteus]|uniref:Na(+)-translocating NADH-quinone reductase subunit B n=1 Tax=Phaeodactylibacter luteus TaxID=1564516 RepID=A0A5C6RZD7_9BACT|nr:NADH:ubiquinone reductase (Na(+)-transporting) subunit B [Phaeodactylibacter luteus]TXB67651.1 NADH:ubiquinone reductase (Na(+)-transporting) subunit B [Phaeodactylibacter luteus]